MTLPGGVDVLTKDQMYAIHRTAVRAATEVGMECHVAPRFFARLAERGATVDESRRRVWPTEPQVAETIRQFCRARSAEITPEGVDADPLRRVLPARLTMNIGANHGFITEENGDMRPAGSEDLFNILRLKKHLPDEPAVACNLVISDLPGPVQYIHSTAFNLKYAGGGASNNNGVADAKWIARMMVAAGKWDQEQEILSSLFLRSPLCITGYAAHCMERKADLNAVDRVNGMPAAGVSAPGTVAGYLVQYLTEVWAGSTIARLCAETPEIRPSALGCDVTAMDLRKGLYIIAGPEISLMRMAMKQMIGQFYKIPGCNAYNIRTFTDAKKPGIQAAMEKTFQAMADVAAGMYSDEAQPTASMNCLGSLNANLSLSYEQAAIDYELYQMLNRMLAGMRVDDDTLGLDAIRRVGPSGEFLSDDHTRRHAHDEWWYPDLLCRDPHETWTSAGRPDVQARARQIVKESRKIDVPCVLPDDVAREIDRLVQAAERGLLGTTTGVLL